MLHRVLSGFSIFCRNFFVSQCRNYSQVNPSVLCFRNFPVAKKFMDKRGGGSIKIFCRKFLSHSAENFRRGIFYCCINFGYRKSLEKRGGEYQDFTSKIFCLTVPKISVGESFTVAIISGIEKVWIRGGGSIKIFRRKFFLSQCRKIS